MKQPKVLLLSRHMIVMLNWQLTKFLRVGYTHGPHEHLVLVFKERGGMPGPSSSYTFESTAYINKKKLVEMSLPKHYEVSICNYPAFITKETTTGSTINLLLMNSAIVLRRRRKFPQNFMRASRPLNRLFSSSICGVTKPTLAW